MSDPTLGNNQQQPENQANPNIPPSQSGTPGQQPSTPQYAAPQQPNPQYAAQQPQYYRQGEAPGGTVPPGYVPPVAGGAQPPSGGGAGGLAITSLILGIASVLLSLVFVGLLLGIGAIVFGIIAAKKNQSKGLWIAGVITGAVGALASLAMIAVTTLAVVQAQQTRESLSKSWASASESYASQSRSRASENAPKDVTIKFEATVKEGKARARYSSSYAGSSDSGFSKSFSKTVNDQVRYGMGSASMTVQVLDYSVTDNKVTCKIYVDGELVNSNEGSTLAMCRYTITK